MTNRMNTQRVLTYVAVLIAGGIIGYILNGQGKEEVLAHDHQHTSTSTEYTCSMHPQIRQPEPGDCPICGMDLVPLEAQGEENGSGEVVIEMSPRAMKLADIQTAKVGHQVPVKEIRLTGRVEVDESRLFSQTTHIGGRIEQLLANTTGQYVNKGDIIAYIYSPELVTAQKELFEAHKIAKTNPMLFTATKEKLRNWKLTEEQVAHILAMEKPIDRFPIRANKSGVIKSRKVSNGEHVQEGAILFELVDLSQLWAQFDIYERDIPWLKAGDKVSFSANTDQQQYEGKISFIDPFINPNTRTAKARVQVINSARKLKPAMFVSGVVEAQVGSEKAIVIPNSAVMWTGKRSVVYVKSSHNKQTGFMMREVVLGASLGDHTLIRSGLKLGEEIAVYGAFNIDAAAQLAGKPSMMSPSSNTGEKAPATVLSSQSKKVF